MRSFPIILTVMPILPALNLLPGSDVALIRLLVPLAAIGWFIRNVRRGRILLPSSPPVVAIAAFVALATASSLWAAEPSFAMRKALLFLSLLPTVLLVGTGELDAAAVTTALVRAASISAAIGVLGFASAFLVGNDAVASFLAQRLAPVLWGEATADAVARFPSWFVDLNGRTTLRAFLPFPNPHTAALLWGMGLGLATASAAAHRWRPPDIARSAMLLAAMLLTFSRGAVAAMLLSAGAFVVWGLPKSSRRIAAPAIACAILLGALLTVLLAPSVADRFASAFDVTEGSNAARLALFRDAFALFRAHPIIGSGLGGFAVAEDPFAPYRTPTNAHSTYLEIAAELGTVGLLLFLLALAAAAWAARRRAHGGSPLQYGVLLALLFFAAHAIFEVDLYSPPNLVAFLSLLTLAGEPWLNRA